MKKFFLSAALLLMAGTASAQFSWCPTVDTDNYQRFHAGFVAEQLTNTGLDDCNDPRGINFGYLAGFSVSDNLPLFVESGANLTWAHSVEDYNTGDFKFTHMNIAVPLNLAYKFTINDRFSIAPFVGFNFRVNLIATQKVNGNKINMLDKDDMGGRDYRGKFFQLGSHYGLGLNISQFYLGWQLESDFMPFLKDAKDEKHRFVNNYLTVGYSF